MYRPQQNVTILAANTGYAISNCRLISASSLTISIIQRFESSSKNNDWNAYFIILFDRNIFLNILITNTNDKLDPNANNNCIEILLSF